MTATITRRRVRTASTRSDQARSGQKVAPKRPTLRVVDKQAIRRRARRRVLLWISASVVACGLFAVALVYAQLAQGQRHLDTLRRDVAASQAEQARLERDVVLASSPDAVVARALEMGMVRADNPVYLTAVEPAPDVAPSPVVDGEIETGRSLDS